MMFKVLALDPKSLRELANEQKLCMPYSIGCFFCDSGSMKNEFNLDFLTTIQKIVNPHLTGIQNIHESTYLTFDKEILIDLNNPLEQNQDLTLSLLTNSDLKVDKSCLIMKVFDKSIESRPGNHILYHCIYIKEEINSNAEKWIIIEDTANKHTYRRLRQHAPRRAAHVVERLCYQAPDGFVGTWSPYRLRQTDSPRRSGPTLPSPPWRTLAGFRSLAVPR